MDFGHFNTRSWFEKRLSQNDKMLPNGGVNFIWSSGIILHWLSVQRDQRLELKYAFIA